MTNFEGSLLAGSIILVVDLTVTYLIVEQLLKRQEKQRWESTLDWFLSSLQSKNQITLLVWAFQKDPRLTGNPPDLSQESHTRFREALRAEVGQLEAEPLAQLRSARPDTYWLDVSRGLGSSDGFIAWAADRGQIALRDRPEMTKLVLRLEDAHQTIAAFRSDDSMFGRQANCHPLTGVVLQSLKMHLELADKLSDVPVA